MEIAWREMETGFVGERCFVHARGGISPDGREIVITTQPLRLSGCDVFYGLYMLRSLDGGQSWSEIVEQPELRRRSCGDGLEIAMSDATPAWHAATGRFLLTGHSVLYRNDELYPPPRPRCTMYSVFDSAAGRWSVPKTLEMPGDWFNCGAGCTQRVDLDNGEILLPEVIMYNSDALAPEDVPTEWDDLLDAKYEDQIIIRDVMASGTMRTIYCCMIYAQGGDDPTAGYEWLAALDKNTKEYAQNPTDLYLKLARQEGTLSLWNLQDIMIQKLVNEQPFDYVIPASGAPILVDAVGIVKGAKNLEGAKAFYEFLFTPEIKLALAENMYQIPAQGDIPQDQLPQWIQDLELVAMDIDWSVVAEKEMEWMTYWDENIKGKN